LFTTPVYQLLQVTHNLLQVGYPFLTTSMFLPRDAMLARYMLLPCVRLSVRLSHAGIVPKRLNLELRKQRRMTAQGL